MLTQDTRPIAELISAATDLSDSDGFGDGTAVCALQDLGTREVLEQALVLVTSDDFRVRARGIDILGQLGIPKRTFPKSVWLRSFIRRPLIAIRGCCNPLR